MKVLNLLLFALFVTGTASAQSPSGTAAKDPAPVTVTESTWRRTVFVPALYEDPMQINQDQGELLREQKATVAANSTRVRQGQAPLPIPGKKTAATPPGSTPMGIPLGDEPVVNRNSPAHTDPGERSVHYLYEAKIINNGEKTIRTVVWTYSLFDLESQAEVGRHRFRSNVIIRAGKSVSLVGRSRNPPAAAVKASKPTKAITDKFSDRVTIDQIEYDDGTFWRSDPATP